MIVTLIAATLLMQTPTPTINRHDSSRKSRSIVYQGKVLDETLDKAAKKIGIKLTPVDKKYLAIIVWRESTGSPHAASRSSTSKGLFGLLSSTHRSYGVTYSRDPVRQCEAGLRYVFTRYKTPARAVAFYNATRKKDSSLAPTDLRKKASFWISKGYKGY